MTTDGINVKESPWGRNIRTPQNQGEPFLVSFNDIMAEQIQELESCNNYENNVDKLLQNSLVFDSSSVDCSRDFELACLLSADPDCSADVLLAEKLQREYDRELELSEKFQRSKEECGIVKATLSADPYHYLHDKDENDDDEEDDDFREFATNLLYERYKVDFPPCGFVKNNNGAIVTKHDREINERKNFSKALELPLDLKTGNVMNGRLSDRVLNDLRTCSKVENRKHIRVKDKDEKALNESSVDAMTRITLLKWINNNEFDRIEGVIATGKESVVLHAVADGIGGGDSGITDDRNEDEEVDNVTDDNIKEKDLDGKRLCGKFAKSENDSVSEPSCSPFNNHQSTIASSHYAIKVYKTTLANFRNRAEYVKDDFRFKNPRRVMKIWAEKEFMNLRRLKRANIRCPTAIRLKKHVLLMSLIGSDEAAPRLKEVEFIGSQSKSDAFEQVRNLIYRMFNDCKLVHGDLSEFNLLYHENTVYVIDVAQAVDVSHSNALGFLHRDITNMLDYFGRIGAEHLPTVHELFTEVTHIHFDPEKNLINQVINFEHENRGSRMRRDKANPADMEWRIYNAECVGRSVSPAHHFN